MLEKKKKTTHEPRSQKSLPAHFFSFYFQTTRTNALSRVSTASLNHDMGGEHNLLDRLEQYNPNEGLKNTEISSLKRAALGHITALDCISKSQLRHMEDVS